MKCVMGWVVLAHVCRHWREVVFSPSDLWTRIPRMMCPLNGPDNMSSRLLAYAELSSADSGIGGSSGSVHRHV